MAWWHVDPASLGDPAGMRALASQLQACASELVSAGAGARRAQKGNALIGPWARSFNALLASGNRTVEASAQELRSLASYLNGKADEVQQQQQAIIRERERQRQLERDRQRREAARRAQGGGGGAW